jgi:ABC-2 type transport system ATP-binding protein
MDVSTKPVIATNNLTRRFGDVVAVNLLSLEVHAGEVFGFLGHNGAGKTTTVRLLNGVLAPSGGTTRVLDLDPLGSGPPLRRRTGVLTETPSLDERLTGRENLQIYADLYDVPHAAVPDRVEELLETFELAHRADEKVGGYSKGMKQRLALARALLHKPELLFLDEPTAGLDPIASLRVHEMITRLSEEEHRTVFLCTHNLAEAQKLCDRVAVLEHGRLVALGTPTELARQLGRSQRLEIEVVPDHVPTTLQVVKGLLDIQESSLENGKVALVGADREAIPDLVASLVAAGVRLYRVAPQEPSLEDVYLALHGKLSSGMSRKDRIQDEEERP